MRQSKLKLKATSLEPRSVQPSQCEVDAMWSSVMLQWLYPYLLFGVVMKQIWVHQLVQRAQRSLRCDTAGLL
jgi:hypothetical protein